MPLVPNFIERTVFLTLNQGPAPLFDMWSGPAFWSVHAALKLDVFETLATGAKSAEQVAQVLAVDARGIGILLGTLKGLGYVRDKNGVFSNTSLTSKWLLRAGKMNLTPIFLYWGAIMEHFMPRLADSIRTGDNVDFYGWIESQPEVSHNFQQGMVQFARFIADEIARKIAVPKGDKRLLDVGGGHGEYTIALCKKNPDLSAVVFDSTQALVTGQETIQTAGLSERIRVEPGDFLQDDLPTGFDVALVFNVVHGLSPAQNVELFRKVKAALNPGGQMVVLEQVHGITPLPLTDAVSHILSVAYYHLIGGQVYTADDIHGWLTEAGYGTITRKTILAASSILFMAVN